MGDTGAEEYEDGGDQDEKHGAEDAESVEEAETAGVRRIGLGALAILNGHRDLEIGRVDGEELGLPDVLLGRGRR